MPGKILDLGCGTGKWPKRLSAPRIDSVVIGIDISHQSCVCASQREPKPGWKCACARGEQLPLADGSVDNVISTVALPYMNIPAALSEIRRVLRPGGSLDVTLHSLPFVLRDLWNHPPVSPASFLYRLYVMGNGFWFHLTGSVVRYPLVNRVESWQSERGMRIALQRAGFAGVASARLPNGSFVTRASHPDPVKEIRAIRPAVAGLEAPTTQNSPGAGRPQAPIGQKNDRVT